MTSLAVFKATIERFPKFFPQAYNRAIYGVIMAIDISDNAREKVLKEALYLACVSDGAFTTQVPRRFRLKASCPNDKIKTNRRKKSGASGAGKGAKRSRRV